MTRKWTFATMAAFVATFAAEARAIPFGADLNLPANVPFDCTVLPVDNALGTGYVPLPSRSPTCTWMPTGSIAQPSAGQLLTPTTGTVTQVRVRVGPITGPMQIVVLRAFRKVTDSTSVCCTEVARTPPFTPAPNAVTTLQTALPVRKDIVPNPFNNAVTFDGLALSVLAPNVPIPAFDSGLHEPSQFTRPTAAVYYPAVAPGQEVFLPTGVGGFQVLVQADVTPGLIAGGGTAIRLVQPTATVRNGAAPILLRCNLATGACGGIIRLQSRNGGGTARAASTHAAKQAKTVTYGKARFSIAAGKSGAVKVTLSTAGRKLLHHQPSAKVWVNATIGTFKIKAARVTLKR